MHSHFFTCFGVHTLLLFVWIQLIRSGEYGPDVWQLMTAQYRACMCGYVEEEITVGSGSEPVLLARSSNDLMMALGAGLQLACAE